MKTARERAFDVLHRTFIASDFDRSFLPTLMSDKGPRGRIMRELVEAIEEEIVRDRLECEKAKGPS